MKYIKTFEGLNTDDIQIGDYVYGEEDKNEESKLLKDFTKNNICKVIDKDEKCSQICVVFDTVPHKKIQSRREMKLYVYLSFVFLNFITPQRQLTVSASSAYI